MTDTSKGRWEQLHDNTVNSHGKMRQSLVALLLADLIVANKSFDSIDLNCQSSNVTVGNIDDNWHSPTKKWRWDPSSQSHTCNIHRMSQSDLIRSFGKHGLPNLYPYPLIIYPDVDDNDIHYTQKARDNSHFANVTAIDMLPKNFSPRFNVTLTGSDSLSSHRRTIPIAQYLDEIFTMNQEIGHGGETLPDQLGNETWYLFGETFTSEWTTLLQKYILPTCHSCSSCHSQEGLLALSFGVGNIGSGVQWHLHGPGFSETVHGRKHWLLYPPNRKPDYDLNYASRHWMEYVYPTLQDWSEDDFDSEKKKHVEYLLHWTRVFKKKYLNNKHDNFTKKSVQNIDGTNEDQGPSNKKPWECTIQEGEIIYFPDHWHHATINLEKYTVFVSTFTTEHETCGSGLK